MYEYVFIVLLLLPYHAAKLLLLSLCMSYQARVFFVCLSTSLCLFENATSVVVVVVVVVVIVVVVVVVVAVVAVVVVVVFVFFWCSLAP